MKATFRPLRWTEPSTPGHARRSRYVFSASWQSTLDLLDRELQHLSARDMVIEADFREQDIRLDGMPRSGAQAPQHPGVRIAFDSVHGPLIYATDSCEFWQHNVRSIALGLEALRAVDRYGVTKRGEQYTGWKQLPAGQPTESPMDRDAAWAVLCAIAAVDEVDPYQPPEVVVRKALRFAHPDTGGSNELWHQFTAARDVFYGART